MKKILIISVEEISVPDNGLLDGGWYSGRQYFKGRFGNPGEILINQHGRDYAEEMTVKQLLKFIEGLLSRRIFIKK